MFSFHAAAKESARGSGSIQRTAVCVCVCVCVCVSVCVYLRFSKRTLTSELCMDQSTIDAKTEVTVFFNGMRVAVLTSWDRARGSLSQ